MLTSLGERPEPATISSNRGPDRYAARVRYNPMYSHLLTPFLMKTGILCEVPASIAPVLAMMGPTPQRISPGARGFSSRVTQTQTTDLFNVGMQARVLPPNAAWISARVYVLKRVNTRQPLLNCGYRFGDTLSVRPDERTEHTRFGQLSDQSRNHAGQA